MIRSLALLLVLASLSGCASYTVPGGPADFRALGITPQHQANLTDIDISERLARRPAASFPAVIATVRVQDGGYSSYSYLGSRGHGKFSVITIREIEDDTDTQRLATLPMVRAIAPLNRLVIAERISDAKDLRAAAADLQADVLLVYTIDTRFGSKTLVPLLGTITLGIFPAKEAQVTATASAALVDVRTGYIYGLAESTHKATQLANYWTTRDAIDDSRLRAEKQAYSKMIAELEKSWTKVAATYGPAAPVSPPPATAEAKTPN